MRFYQGLLPAIQWDKTAGKPFCEFKHGILDTDDEELIKFLHEKGYLVQEDVEHLEAGGRLDHGGFEPQVSKDNQLPSGRPPMDNPEMAQGGTPHKRGVVTDSLPDNEQMDMAKETVTEKPKVTKRAKPKAKPKTAAKKSTAKSKAKTTAKRSIKRRVKK